MGNYEDTLNRLGFDKNKDPFQYQFGEKTTEEILEKTWVTFPDAEKILDLEQSSVLLAPPGSGKTTWRRYIEKIIAQSSHAQYLVVIYNRFQILSNSRISLKDHQDPLCRQIAQVVLDYLLDKQNNAGTVQLQTYWSFWYAFLNYYLPKYNKLALEKLLLPNNTPSNLLPQWDNDIDDLQKILLDELLPALSDLGIDRLYLLLDDFDGLLETKDPKTLSALIEPLINTNLLLSSDKLIWKFFVPDTLESIIRQSTGYKTRRLEKYSVEWDEFSLGQLLELRLAYASGGKINDINQLFSNDVLKDFDPHREVCKLALQAQDLGSPRHLLRSSRQLLESVSGFVITNENWNDFRNKQLTIRENLISQQIAINKLKEILRERFDLAELKELCFDLRIDYEDLIGTNKTEKVISLINHLDRHDRLSDFLEFVQQKRPDIDWTKATLHQTESNKANHQFTQIKSESAEKKTHGDTKAQSFSTKNRQEIQTTSPFSRTVNSISSDEVQMAKLKLQLGGRIRKKTRKFETRVMESLNGADPPGNGWLPFNLNELTTILKALDDIARGQNALAEDFSSEEEQILTKYKLLNDKYYAENLLEVVGQMLFKGLLKNDDVRQSCQETLRLARQPGNTVLFQIRLDADAVELARYPWELLHDSNRHISRVNSIQMVRYITHNEATTPLHINPPIRLLYVRSRPRVLYTPINEQEYQSVQQSLQPLIEEAFLDVKYIHNCSYDAFICAVQEYKPHILHFDGHGEFGCYCKRCKKIYSPLKKKCNVCDLPLDTPKGHLAFEQVEDSVDWINSDKIASIFDASLRLAVLSACRSSVVRSETLFNGVAPSLIRSGVPAVVGTQLPVSFHAANKFSEGFYASLSRYEPVPVAVASGRQRLINSEEWFIPVLYLRSADDDGRIFVRA